MISTLYLNREMILKLIAEHLADVIEVADLGVDLAMCFCHPESCAVACDDEAPAESCRPCLERWLEQPYTEQFDLRDGLIVLTPGGRET